MADNLLDTQNDINKKSKLKIIYDTNKKLIYSIVLILLILFGSIIFYFENKERKNILLSENYLQAKIYLHAGEKSKAKTILEEIFFSNNPTYSSLSLFLIMSENLITDNNEIINLFDHLIANNKFSSEIENLLIYKKALLISSNDDELELLQSLKPLLNDETLWKPHALLLIGNYYVSKGDNIKAKEFFQQIFLIKNLHNDLYRQAQLQLAAIINE